MSRQSPESSPAQPAPRSKPRGARETALSRAVVELEEVEGAEAVAAHDLAHPPCSALAQEVPGGSLLGQHLDDFQRIVLAPASMSVIRFVGDRPFVLAMNVTSGGLGEAVGLARSTSAESTVGGATGATQ